MERTDENEAVPQLTVLHGGDGASTVDVCKVCKDDVHFFGFTTNATGAKCTARLGHEETT